jgi:hypothetical protein
MSTQSRHGPITRRVIEALRRQVRMKVVDLAAFRAGHEYAEALQNTVTPKEQLAETHPAHAAYVYAQNQMSVMAEQLLQLPEMKSFVKQIGPAEDEYAPSWPPMSPISTSFFVCWSTYDLAIGARRETLGDVIIAVAAECGTHPGILTIMQALQGSRMGIYRVQEQDGARVRLHDLAAGHTFTAMCASGYSGRVGEIWYTRVLPPPLTGAEHVVFTSPYVLTAPDVAAWTAYLDRVASKKPADSRAEALEQHFKWGPNPRYWLVFVFEAYSRHESGAIFLHGLPDVAESRPHSPSYRPIPAQSATPAEGDIDVQAPHLNVETGSLSLQGTAGDLRGAQTMKVSLSFPDRKISETFLEFAEPLLEKEGTPPTAQEADRVLQFASTIWNSVVLDTVHGKTEWVTRVRNQFAAHPPLEALIERMILRKQRLFGHDLRLIGEFKILEKDGEWRLRAEARAPTAP